MTADVTLAGAQAPARVALVGRVTQARWDRWAVSGVFLVTGFAMVTGGLAIAPVVATGGVVALMGRLDARFWRGAATWDPTVWVTAAFFAWAIVSFAWSPYDAPDRVVRLAAGAPAYALFVVACAGVAARDRADIEALLLFAALSACAAFALEIASGGALTRAYGRWERPQGEVWRNLGHGLSVLAALVPAVAAGAWIRGGATRAAAAVVIVTVAAGGVVFEISGNLLGLLAGGAAMAAACVWPRASVVAAGALAGLSVAAAPVIGLLAHAPPAWRARLPLSWEQRLEIWRRVASGVAEAPIFGHGLDGMRTHTDYMELRGVRFDAMALHPHNAGLHVWYETGAVGAALLTIAVTLGAWRAARWPGLTRPAAVAAAGTILSFTSMAGVSYGVWQEWWIATAFLALGACVLVGAAARGERKT